MDHSESAWPWNTSSSIHAKRWNWAWVSVSLMSICLMPWMTTIVCMSQKKYLEIEEPSFFVRNSSLVAIS